MAAPTNSKCILCYKYTYKYLLNGQNVFRQLTRTAAGDSSFRRESENEYEENKDSEGFRRYKLKKISSSPDGRPRRKDNRFFHDIKPTEPRSSKMRVDQDWTNVWPAAQTFNWSVVPLPIKQGVLKNNMEAKGDGLPPAKRGNTELIKIPNFLHLTPNHIKKHCEAIKKFCTKWPAGLKTEEEMDYHFPLEVITADYCFSSPSIRDPRARTVTFKFKTSDLEMDEHAKDKWQKLTKSRKDDVVLISDRCPLRLQNYEYLQYLLTALYFESWKVEAWESEITPDDLLDYSWDYSSSKTNLVNLLNTYREQDQTVADRSKRLVPYISDKVTPDTVASLEPVNDYKQSVEELYYTGENITTLNNYKESVLKMLNVKVKSVDS